MPAFNFAGLLYFGMNEKPHPRRKNSERLLTAHHSEAGLPHGVPVPWMLPQARGLWVTAHMNREPIADCHSTLADVYLFHLKCSEKRTVTKKERSQPTFRPDSKTTRGSAFFLYQNVPRDAEGVSSILII